MKIGVFEETFKRDKSAASKIIAAPRFGPVSEFGPASKLRPALMGNRWAPENETEAEVGEAEQFS